MVPFIFVLVAIALLINTWITSRVESTAGLVLIALGLPIYFWQRARNRAAARQPEAKAPVSG